MTEYIINTLVFLLITAFADNAIMMSISIYLLEKISLEVRLGLSFLPKFIDWLSNYIIHAKIGS